MASCQNIFILLIFISSDCKPITCATFENVSVILKWRSEFQDNKTVTVLSDDYLRNYVGEFGEVIINNQNIQILTPDSVSNLAKVTHLHLTDSKLRKIQIGAFRNLPRLTDLNLSGNLLERIENGIFDNLNFKSLYLENNKITSIGDRVFNNLKMEYLFIDDNRISEWNSDWFNGTPLRSISIRNNLIENVKQLAFEYLWHLDGDVILQNFLISGNKLKYIHRDAFEGVKLIYSLGLQNNSLKYLPPGLFDHVEVIDYLDLSNNLISSIQYQTFWKTKISELNMYNNFITCISIDILNVTEIQKLNVGKNPISCGCYESWNNWKEKFVLEVTNVGEADEGCKSSACASRSQILFLLVFFVLLKRF